MISSVPPVHWSKDFVEHLRTVHFGLIAVCAGLIVVFISAKPYKPAVALQQVHQIIGSSIHNAAYQEVKPVVSPRGANTNIHSSPLVTNPKGMLVKPVYEGGRMTVNRKLQALKTIGQYQKLVEERRTIIAARRTIIEETKALQATQSDLIARHKRLVALLREGVAEFGRHLKLLEMARVSPVEPDFCDSGLEQSKKTWLN